MRKVYILLSTQLCIKNLNCVIRASTIKLMMRKINQEEEVEKTKNEKLHCKNYYIMLFENNNFSGIKQIALFTMSALMIILRGF